MVQYLPEHGVQHVLDNAGCMSISVVQHNNSPCKHARMIDVDSVDGGMKVS
jgi:hypothetical protein